ncbi:MAG: hypothetical protein WCB10_07090 [Steroidobacteraceae bacterium]|jgi:hypothetical protein
MKRMPRTWKVAALGALALTGLTACFVGGYDGGGGVGYVGGVYQPGGYEYGRWGPGYHVGPPRGDEHGPGGRAPPPIPHNARHGGGDDHRNGAKGH